MNEKNPKTKKFYTSEATYNSDLTAWQNLITPVNPFLLFQAYQIYIQEKERSLTLKSDKMSHCYIGCQIRQKTNFQTVQYVAWLKEFRDLKDCNPRSHFELDDFEATILGGGLEAPTAAGCVALCQMELHQILSSKSNP